MEIFEAFTAHLQNYAGLTAFIGNDGVYPDILPQDRKQAAITYQAIGGDVNDTLTGSSGLNRPTYQFSCFGNSNKEAFSVYKQLKAAMRNYQGTMGGLTIQRIRQVSEPVKDYEADTKRHSYKVDFEINYNE